MTELQEKRWKCDWCGNVSPVLEKNPDHMQGYAAPYQMPPGWAVRLSEGGKTQHFCCFAHRDDFLADRQRSGETELME